MSVSEQNKNLSKVRDDVEAYFGNILRSGHGSVLEHAYVTFAFEDVTRVFTHEIVRHRLCNFSQESLRFVRPTSLNMYFPDVFDDLSEPFRAAVKALFEDTVEHLEGIQGKLVKLLGMDVVGKAFGDKKKLQSAMRRLMPIGMCTGIVVTANLRNWRHLIALRTNRHAEEEIRKAFSQVAEILGDRYMAVFQDMHFEPFDGINEFTFKFGRV